MSKPIEIRRDPDGTIDEIIADGSVHLEMMDHGYAWIGITTRDGKTLHVDIQVRRRRTKRGKRTVLTVQTREG